MVDQAVVERKLMLLAEYVQDLKEIQQITFEEFTSDKRLRRYVERTLHVALEACFDIGSHWISDQGWREPSTYREIVIVLAENGIFTMEQAGTYQKMAQFRNLLVHDYAKIEPEILLNILRRNVVDLEIFVQRFEQLLHNGAN
ncbi:DUF86 domain-containing protein [Sporomusa sp. KB1]|jgi:uncharacterized protein YutE (UPF0331/DUF86 family)|uniref:type VII toxin-antitoxin system HepT family RNase toxin n=1 Tax=Sporomusa sp. KB1 TaxID=943346 RepID=UPI00119D9459|nr:DUF86 domain-containing protein [Sporomusa sp. KB1]TWH47932.1 uncharacterized protein YutE (UPF0331/DUF86 family) [Sporomusa sp. KB1]